MTRIFYMCTCVTIAVLLFLLLQKQENFRLGFTKDQLDDKEEIKKNVNTVNVQLVFTETIVLVVNSKKDAIIYNPREALKRNFSIKFDRKIRYIRICDNGACDPMTSYVIDMIQINQSLRKNAFRNDKVYVLEEEPTNSWKPTIEDYVVNAKDSTVKITTVLHTLAPVNAQLTIRDILDLVENDGNLKIYIQKTKQMLEYFSVHSCTVPDRQSYGGNLDANGEALPSLDEDVKNECYDIEWSENISVPDIESDELTLAIEFRPT
jgi:hypothetical protein